jgi:hypothetical protein
MGEIGWVFVALATAIIVVGALSEWRLALLAACFGIPHILVGHKEARFMLPIAPILAALGAAGFSELCRALSSRQRRTALIAASLVMATVAAVRVPQLRWDTQPFRSQAYLLNAAGQRPDLTGFLIYGYLNDESGNYFYLRRDVPLVAVVELNFDEMERSSADKRGPLNYLFCRTTSGDKFAAFRPVAVAVNGEFTLYRLDSPGSMPGPARRETI